MSVLATVKLVVAIVVLLGVGGTVGHYVWEYRHRGQVIEEQAQKIANLELEKKVAEKAAKAEKKVAEKTTIIYRREKADVQKIDQALESKDANRVIDMFYPYGVRPGKGGVQTPANG